MSNAYLSRWVGRIKKCLDIIRPCCECMHAFCDLISEFVLIFLLLCCVIVFFYSHLVFFRWVLSTFSLIWPIDICPVWPDSNRTFISFPLYTHLSVFVCVFFDFYSCRPFFTRFFLFLVPHKYKYQIKFVYFNFLLFVFMLCQSLLLMYGSFFLSKMQWHLVFIYLQPTVLFLLTNISAAFFLVLQWEMSNGMDM